MSEVLHPGYLAARARANTTAILCRRRRSNTPADREFVELYEREKKRELLERLTAKYGDASWMLELADATTPPRGYVGIVEITTAPKWRKNGKNPAPSTIDRWINRDPPNPPVWRDPATCARWFPPKWLTAQFNQWGPRTVKS